MKMIHVNAADVATAMLALVLTGSADTAPIEQALAKVNANCPHRYPEKVTPLPEPQQLAALETSTLIDMLASWNPSLRATAAKELGKRGSEQIQPLLKGTRSDNWTLRAGSTEALAAIAKSMRPRGPAAVLPGELNELAHEFIRLSDDPELEVRVAALGALSKLAPQTAAATKAVLKLCADDDVYLAQDAMIALDQRFTTDTLQKAEVITAFKEALKTPLPRGKSHIMRQISRMDDKTQRLFIPDLLTHLDWNPMRDTMFGAGGQQEALEMLTQMKVKEVIPRLPKLMGKEMRGPGMFIPCLESAMVFGKDAKVILPEMKKILTDIEKNGENAAIRPKNQFQEGAARLKDTIVYLEAL